MRDLDVERAVLADILTRIRAPIDYLALSSVLLRLLQKCPVDRVASGDQYDTFRRSTLPVEQLINTLDAWMSASLATSLPIPSDSTILDELMQHYAAELDGLSEMASLLRRLSPDAVKAVLLHASYLRGVAAIALLYEKALAAGVAAKYAWAHLALFALDEPSYLLLLPQNYLNAVVEAEYTATPRHRDEPVIVAAARNDSRTVVDIRHPYHGAQFCVFRDTVKAIWEVAPDPMTSVFEHLENIEWFLHDTTLCPWPENDFSSFDVAFNYHTLTETIVRYQRRIVWDANQIAHVELGLGAPTGHVFVEYGQIVHEFVAALTPASLSEFRAAPLQYSLRHRHQRGESIGRQQRALRERQLRQLYHDLAMDHALREVAESVVTTAKDLASSTGERVVPSVVKGVVYYGIMKVLSAPDAEVIALAEALVELLYSGLLYPSSSSRGESEDRD